MLYGFISATTRQALEKYYQILPTNNLKFATVCYGGVMMQNVENIVLKFDKCDYGEAKDLILQHLGENSFTSEGVANKLYDAALDPTLLINLSKVAIPAISALLAIWLGKGKKVTVYTKRKNGDEQIITLQNLSEDASQKHIESLLENSINN